tara:strand:- start:98 stop:568 length:471 start_codon:yes stop_codon:yes gene_type:complete
MDIKFQLDNVFRETENVTFYDISVINSNASDLVIHKTAAKSPPDDKNGNKQFYVHYHQVDNNRVITGERTFELVNFEWENPYQIIRLKREDGALTIPKGTFHRSVSGLSGSIVINQAIRDDLFEAKSEFEPVSICNNKKLSEIILNAQPLIHKNIS